VWRSPNCGERLAVEQRTSRHRVGETEGKRKRERERLIERGGKSEMVFGRIRVQGRERESAGERERERERETEKERESRYSRQQRVAAEFQCSERRGGVPGAFKERRCIAAPR